MPSQKGLLEESPQRQTRFARAWAGWENALASMRGGASGESPADYARAFARLECHYFLNGAFLDEDGHILRRVGRIAHLPCAIVQGRFDMICPPASAHALHRAWPGSTLTMVADAGHALSEPGITAALVSHMKKVAHG